MNLFNIFGIKKAEQSGEDDRNGAESCLDDQRRSLCAVISDTEKEVNQDACGTYYDELSGTTVVAVADGIGSNKHVEAGSRFVVDKALELVSSCLERDAALDYTQIFSDIQAGLTAMVDREFSDQLSTISRKDFGTTLIVGVDTQDTFTIAYLGNGCAYYMMGDFVKFPDVNYLPWNINNLLVPHSLPDEVTGQEALCKYFSYKPAIIDQCVPTVISISKNHHAGEIFVIGTDGVDSLDKHDEFAFSHNELMMTSSWSMSLLCDRIKKTLESSSELSDELLYQMLEKYMITLRNEDRMDDDTTIGVIMSPKVFQKE